MGTHVEQSISGEDCELCYPTHKTPKYVYASFSGISIGQAWVPGIPVPPNRTFKLVQVTGCKWVLAVFPWHVQYEAVTVGLPGVGSQLIIRWVSVVGLLVFFNQNILRCITGFNNQVTDPPPHLWHGGAGWIFQ